MQQRPEQTRLLYLDNLRALAMLTGVFFHAALAYSPMAHSIWPSADPLQHPAFDVFAWASHLFRMPLFFLLAGFFSAMLLEKRGTKRFFSNRFQRIALPLLLFLPVLTLLMGWVIAFGMVHVQQQPPFLQFIASVLTQSHPPPMPLSTMHLWFLYHLLFLYLLTWCCRTLVDDHLKNRLLDIPATLWVLGLIVAGVPALFAVSVPFPAPEWIFPALWALWFYGLFYALGYAIFLKPDFLQTLDPARHLFFGIGVISYALYYTFLPNALSPEQQPQGLFKLMLALLEAICAVVWTLASLLYARRRLELNHPLFTYLAKVSYWVYLVHLPLLFLLQFLIIDLSLPLVLKFLLASIGTLAISILLFHLLVAWNGLSRLVTSTRSR